MLGFAAGYADPSWFSVNIFRGIWRADGYMQGFKLSGTTLYRQSFKFREGEWQFFEVGTAPGSDDNMWIPCTAYLMDANGLT